MSPLQPTIGAEEERAARYAPQMSQIAAAPTMAMSLEQTLTVDAAPVEEEVAEEKTAMPVTPVLPTNMQQNLRLTWN